MSSFATHAQERRPAYLVLALGVVATVFATWGVYARDRSLARASFESRAAGAIARVDRSFRIPLGSLHATAALLAAEPELERGTFQRFARPLLDRYPSLAALEWAVIVDESQRADFERRMSERRGHPFEIHEPGADGTMVRSPAHDRHVVLVLLEPHVAALDGFDARFEPVRRTALDAVIDRREPMATGRFRLVEDPEGVYSVAVYEPVLAREGQPTAPSTPGVAGLAIALYRIDALVRGALGDDDLREFDLGLVDEDASGEDKLLFASRAGADVPRAGAFTSSRRMDFAGRSWRAVVTQAPAPVGILVFITAGVGLFFSAVAALFAHARASAKALRRRVDALARTGEYVLLRELGSGGMGTVFEAKHKTLRRRAAIKLVRLDKTSEETLQRFAREAQTTSELQHPNTVTLFDYGRTDDGRFYFAMEFLIGMTLETLVEKHGRQSPARVRHILVQICSSLVEAHERGFVHRDIKPANLMVCVHAGMHDFVKVLDFGLAKNLDRAEKTLSGVGLIVGTMDYIAPECLLDPDRAGPASDQYAVGCVAYYLIMGREPFAGGGEAATVAAHLVKQAPPMEGRAPAELEAIVMRCLAKAPEERFASMRQLSRALSRLSLPPWGEVEASEWWHDHAADVVKRAAVEPSPTSVGNVRPVSR